MKVVSLAGLVCSIAVSLGACSPLAPRPDHSRFFILTPDSTNTDAYSKPVATGASTLTLGIGPIDFPGYLPRPELVTLASANEVEQSRRIAA